MKQKVRLTESQLHKVIKESVRQVLSELDWKTYQNAAIKANGGHLEDTSSEEFKDDNGLPILGRRHEHSVRTGDSPYSRVETKKHYEGPTSMNKRARFFADAAVSAFNKQHPSRDYRKLADMMLNGGLLVNLNNKYNHDGYFNYISTKCDDETYDKASQDMRDYWDGNYEYQKGKGWQKKDGLDESIRRAIRKVLR